MTVLCPIPIVHFFKYLDIQVSPMLTDYCRLNMYPLLTHFRAKIIMWNKLKMSVAGRTNLIKMILMPQLLYFLHNFLVVVPLKLFRVVNSLFRTLLWNNHPLGSNLNYCNTVRLVVAQHSLIPGSST